MMPGISDCRTLAGRHVKKGVIASAPRSGRRRGYGASGCGDCGLLCFVRPRCDLNKAMDAASMGMITWLETEKKIARLDAYGLASAAMDAESVRCRIQQERSLPDAQDIWATIGPHAVSGGMVCAIRPPRLERGAGPRWLHPTPRCGVTAARHVRRATRHREDEFAAIDASTYLNCHSPLTTGQDPRSRAPMRAAHTAKERQHGDVSKNDYRAAAGMARSCSARSGPHPAGQPHAPRCRAPRPSGSSKCWARSSTSCGRTTVDKQDDRSCHGPHQRRARRARPHSSYMTAKSFRDMQRTTAASGPRHAGQHERRQLKLVSPSRHTRPSPAFQAAT